MVADRMERQYADAGDRAGRAFSNNLERTHFTRVGTQAGREYGTSFSAAASSGVDQFNRDLQRKMDVSRDHLSRQGSEAGRLFAQGVSSGMDTARQSASGLSSTITELGTGIASLGRIATPAAIVGLGAAMVQLGSVAASAAQSLWLLPAAVGAAGAAMGTIKLATVGLEDAFSSMGDPAKFSESLRNLAPSAQQFMLSIQSMMPTLEGFQRATQGALFEGIGPQVSQLVNQYLPMVQQATTGIATAINQAFSGVADQLMTPETQGAIQSFLASVTDAFSALAPAAAPLTRALADIMAVGGSALPGIAQAATNAANAFANFISEARASGDLQKWLSEGLTTLQQLGSVVWAAGEAFMSLAPMAQDILPTVVDLLEKTQTIMPAIAVAAMTVGAPIGLWAAAIGQAATGFEAIKTVVESVGNVVIPIINRIGQNLDHILEPIRALAALIPGMPEIPHYSPVTQFDTSGAGGVTEFRGGVVPGGPLGTTYQSQLGGPANASRERRGLAPVGPGTAGLDPFTGASLPSSRPGWGIPEPAGQGWNPQETYRKHLEEINGTTGGSGLPGAPSVPLAPAPAIDPRLQMTAALFGAQGSAQDAATRVAEKEARVNQLKTANNATADDILNAENDAAKARREKQEADMRFAEAQRNALEQQTKQTGQMAGAMQEFGAQLDQDFGISKGLPGILENVTRFLGNLIAAPALAQLNAIAGMNPNEGSGMMGILAANGALGQQYTPGAIAAASGSGGATGASYSTTAAPGYGYPGGGNVAAMMNLAQSSSGNVAYAPASDLVNGLADCSGSISDLYEVLTTGGTTAGREFTTTNFASDAQAAKLGFLPGFQPGALNVGVNPYPGQSGHMAATLPNGVNFEGGGGTGGGAQYGGGASGAQDPQFEKQYYFPVGGSPAAAPAPGGWQGPTSVPAYTGGAGESPIWGGSPGQPIGTGAGVGVPGIGTGVGQAAGTAPLGGQPYPSGSPGSGIGAGGMAMDAAMMATSGLDMIAPGAGAAAKIGIQVANRTIKYAGQVAGIAAGGLLDTITPAGDNPKASIGNSWFGKILGGVAGAAPAIPNAAGAKQKPPGPMGGPGQPGQPGQAQAPGGPPSVTLNQTNNHTTADVATGSAVREMGAAFAQPGRQ